MRGTSLVIGLAVSSFASVASAAGGPVITVLYTSQHDTNFTDPSNFTGTPLIDKAGNLYVTSQFGGARTLNALGTGSVLKLSPPAPGKTAWTATILHDFGKGADGSYPSAGFIKDNAGNLYTTAGGGGSAGMGAVVMLSPPAAGKTAWTEKVIYSFGNGPDGDGPAADLTSDKAGDLYTTAQGGLYGQGTLVKLSPPAPGKTSWTETTLYEFGSTTAVSVTPTSSPIADAAGNLYMTAGGGTLGVLLMFSPPANGQTSWRPKILYDFSGGKDGGAPRAGLIADAAGNLYTTTAVGGNLLDCPTTGCGAVVKLSPPAPGKTRWTETAIYRFKGVSSADPYRGDGAIPSAKLLADAAGNLYTTTRYGGNAEVCPNNQPFESGVPGCGTIVKLSPPAAGTTAWTETVLYRFQGHDFGHGLNDGFFPLAGLVADAKGNLYTTVSGYNIDSSFTAGSVVKLSGVGFVAAKSAQPAAGAR